MVPGWGWINALRSSKFRRGSAPLARKGELRWHALRGETRVGIISFSQPFAHTWGSLSVIFHFDSFEKKFINRPLDKLFSYMDPKTEHHRRPYVDSSTSSVLVPTCTWVCAASTRQYRWHPCQYRWHPCTTVVCQCDWRPSYLYRFSTGSFLLSSLTSLF
jgi:hypothetical protein